LRKLFTAVLFVAGLAVLGAISANADAGRTASSTALAPQTHQVRVPDGDRFTPFGLTIHAGDSVRWVNGDEDDHTVVTDDAFTTADNKGVNRLLPVGGSVVLHFDKPGSFVYYCRFHAHLDGFNQPVAPGPDGGVQDANGNFGTPMSGAITVLPR
jgi:plastocyanin